MTKTMIIEACASHYLESGDFNGITLGNLSRKLSLDEDQLCNFVRELVLEDKLALIGPESGNPHIFAFPFKDNESQLQVLESANQEHSCVYVRPKTLKSFVPDSLYIDQPFRRMLACGEPQLEFKKFDLMVLEDYRNDPRYYYENWDIGGRICAKDTEPEQAQLPDADRVVLKTYGFAYDESLNRAVACFLRYLSRLSPSHQQMWRARQIEGEFTLHPGYAAAEIGGSWKPHTSICVAFLGELYLINRMTEAMGRPRLFRVDFGEHGETKPADFSLLIRPTQKEFQSFVLLLDKTLSDNLRHKFFGPDISFEYEQEREDGRIEVKRKGMLQALKEWLKSNYQTSEDGWGMIEENLNVLWDVRKLRQRPAHSLDDNEFDQDLFRQQRELVDRSHRALMTIRMMLESHPAVKKSGISVPSFLEEKNVFAF